MNQRDHEGCTWAPSAAYEAVRALLRVTGSTSPPAAPAAPSTTQPTELARCLSDWLAPVGHEVEELEIPVVEIAEVLSQMGPSLVRVSRTGALLALTGRATTTSLQVVSSAGRTRMVSRERVAEAVFGLAGDRTRRRFFSVESALASAGVGEERRERASRALLRGAMAGSSIPAVAWSVRAAPDASLWKLLRSRRIPTMLAALFALFALYQAAWVVSWWILGRGALAGTLDATAIVLWAMGTVGSGVALSASTWLQGRVAIMLGIVVRRRLMWGALAADDDQRRSTADTVARILESSKIEGSILSGGIELALAVVELGSAAVLIGLGAHSLELGTLFVSMLLATSLALVEHDRATAATAVTHVDATTELIATMHGHRTRLIQQRPSGWHHGQDALANRYLGAACSKDRWSSAAIVLGPRVFLILGLLLCAHSVFAVEADPGWAYSLGALLVGAVGLGRLARAGVQMSMARVGWNAVAELEAAASGARESQGHPLALPPPRPDGGELLRMRDVRFTYPGTGRLALDRAQLSVAEGDRVLLTGASGSGKSTLASILAGQRRASGGALTFRGIDAQTVGSRRWRERVAFVPQFNDNFVFSETMAFNLLIARQWPPRAEDLQDALTVCRELGLGDLLDRMPNGLQQTVGETGWQLSHGERSRLFVARALLQDSDVLVFDESFSALDGVTLQRVLPCIDRRANAVVTVAHP